VDGHELPSRRSKPFIIGVYQGQGEPNVHPFFCDIRKELNRLNKKTILPENETRCVTVIVRAIIADAPARCWMCVIKYYSGWYGCPRCKTKGVHPRVVKQTNKPAGKKSANGQLSTTNRQSTDEQPAGEQQGGANAPGVNEYITLTTVKFPDINKDLPRITEEWESYLEIPAGQAKNMAHRQGKTPLDKIYDIDPIYDVPLEEMHLMDLGVLKDTVEFLLKLKIDKNATNVAVPKRRGRPAKTAFVDGSKRKKLKNSTPKTFHDWNLRIQAWSKLTPKEFGRKMSSLDYFGMWKSVLYRQFFMYYMPALMHTENEINFDSRKREAVLNIILGYRLVTGNTHKPVPDLHLAKSKELLCRAFEQMKQLSGGSWCTYKCHCISHITDDAKNFQCHLGSLSAYPYESQMVHFRRMRLQGTNVIQQIANRLMEKGHLEDFDNENACNYDDESFESFYERITRNATSSEMSVSDILDIPPFFVNDFNAKRQTVQCEGFTITNKLPNNFVRLHFTKKQRRARNAFVIDNIFRDTVDGELKFYAREFVELTNSFEKPYPSSLICNFVASGGLNNDEIISHKRQPILFSRIIGKYFPFPTVMCSVDCNGDYFPSDSQQVWVLQEIMHSE
jgi:hypothetical protein